jgi:hypothetical protein
MDKRRFLALTSLAGLAPAVHAALNPPARSTSGPGLLTVSGAIGQGNRGPIDPALDQMMVKHKVAFDRAHVFDAAALQRLVAVQIRPTLEYDAKVHALSGPLLSTVLEAAGVPPAGDVTLTLRAVDGYAVNVTLADARAYRMIVATTIDGHPLALGGLGPQWAVYEADTVAAFKDKPLKERFALCPWGLYHVEAKRA